MRELAPAPPNFNPGGWLSSWSDAGGIALRVGDRLYIGRQPAIDGAARARLDALRAQIWQPGAAAALGDYLHRRSRGEVHG